jgi:hypothetical protein
LLEDFGNMVSVNGQKIPAVNIQVEGVPGYIYHEDFGAEWWGVYFEILFEQGYLWIVSQGSVEHLDDPKIYVHVHTQYAWEEKRRFFPDLTITCAHWDDFLEMYNSHRKDSNPGALMSV